MFQDLESPWEEFDNIDVVIGYPNDDSNHDENHGDKSPPITNMSSKPIKPSVKRKKNRRIKRRNKHPIHVDENLEPDDFGVKVVESGNGSLKAVIVKKDESYSSQYPSQLPQISDTQFIRHNQNETQTLNQPTRELSHLPQINIPQAQRIQHQPTIPNESRQTIQFGFKRTPVNPNYPPPNRFTHDTQTPRTTERPNISFGCKTFSNSHFTSPHQYTYSPSPTSNRPTFDNSSDDMSENSGAPRWNDDIITDKDGPWTEYYVTAKDVREGGHCTVCYTDFEVGEKTVKLNCDHVFHEECVLMWFNTKRSNPTCPFCRKSMYDCSHDDIDPSNSYFYNDSDFYT